jgi:uncharacterized membrane protein
LEAEDVEVAAQTALVVLVVLALVFLVILFLSLLFLVAMAVSAAAVISVVVGVAVMALLHAATLRLHHQLTSHTQEYTPTEFLLQ